MRFIFLLRAHHWVKNLFIFIPAFFAGEVFAIPVMVSLIQGFACFCLMASSIYILNDLKDIESDRIHPKKKNRPLASGKVPVSLAIILAVLMSLSAVLWAFLLDRSFFYFILVYAGINVLYSLGLKKIALLDIFIVSLGFLIRILAGGVVADVFISQWLIIMVFLLALFLSFAKRRDDLVLAQKSGTEFRAVSSRYNMEFINTCLALISGVIMVSYIMYTISDEVTSRMGTDYLYITAIFVFAGLLRYLQITQVNNDSGSPTKVLLTDRFVQVTVLGWILTFFVTLYV